MKKSQLLTSVALAGMILGAQVAMADHHEEKTKEEQGKNSCQGKEKNGCDGKNHCDGKTDGKSHCAGKAEAKEHEHPAAPAKPAKKH